MTFPWPDPPGPIRCRRCGHRVQPGRDLEGYGSDCATLLGVTVATPRLRADPQTGPDLFTNDEEDHCDGWDR